MRRIVTAGTAALVCLFWPVAAAQATFHLEKVNEVMLASANGDSGVQFVELLDQGGSEEAFPPVFAPFKLVVYDGAGKQLGEQTLDPTGLRSHAGAGTEYLISTGAADSALGVTGDERLTVALPPGAAQVCFQGNPGNVSCITYGSISQPVAMSSNGSGSQHGPVPPNGQSDQRQPDNSIQSAPPTPRTPNRAGAGTAAPDPVSPEPPATPKPGAFAGVGFPSRTARVDQRGRAQVSLSCPAQASGHCRGTVTLSADRPAARLGRATFTLAAGERAIVRVGLSSAARRTLARRGRLSVRARVAARDGGGHQRTTSVQLTLRR